MVIINDKGNSTMSNVDPTENSVFGALNSMKKAPPASGSGGIFKIPKGGAHGMDAFKAWLGPKQYKQFISTLLQSITNAMKADAAAADLASRKLKAVQEDRDPDEET